MINCTIQVYNTWLSVHCTIRCPQMVTNFKNGARQKFWFIVLTVHIGMGRATARIYFQKLGHPWSPDTLLYTQCVALNRTVQNILFLGVALFPSFISCSLSHQSNKTESALFRVHSIYCPINYLYLIYFMVYVIVL